MHSCRELKDAESEFDFLKQKLTPKKFYFLKKAKFLSGINLH